jgi:hypothetical protein
MSCVTTGETRPASGCPALSWLATVAVARASSVTTLAEACLWSRAVVNNPAATVQPAPEHPPGPAQFPGGLLLGLVFEVAKHQRVAVFLGQTSEFFMEHLLDFLKRDIPHGVSPRYLLGLLFPRPPATPLGLESDGKVIRHLIQPGSQRLAAADAGRLLGEDQKGGLEHILGVVPVPQDPAGDVEHHGPVPADQGHEGLLVMVRRKAIQQLFIRALVAARASHEPMDVVEGGVHQGAGHGPAS